MKLIALLVAPLLLGGCALAALGSAVGAAAVGPGQVQPATWRKVDMSTGQIQDIGGLEQLARDFPDSSSVRLRLGTAYIREGDKAKAAEQVGWLLDRGYAFTEAGQATLIAFFEDFDPQLNGRIGRQPETIADSSVVATVPAGARLIEDVVQDPVLGGWVVSSIVDRAIYHGTETSGQWNWRRHDIAGAGSLAGSVRANIAPTLWFASGAYDVTPAPDTAFRGLIAYSVADGTVVHRIAAPEGATPSDIALSGKGPLYASDPLSGAVYTAGTDDAELRMLVEPGTLRSPQGLVPLPGGRQVIVSDYRYGLARIDVRSGSVRRIAATVPVALDGFDGLWLIDGKIVGIQNGFSPQRIVSLTFDRNYTQVTDVAILEQAHPDWIEPLGGTILGRAFYYIGNGQWSRFGEGGMARTDAPPLPTHIRRLPLPSPTD
ncbi:hypothetical protein GCM10010923_11680 [Blastomonas marina]|uniref:Uncharacterized protein n=1 Tax=Blastomonas marina TaxID=1867408 RepID=A0ABQ1F9T9_9SPHN|nr:hypothetical protein [Blastomonas marina]GGA04230.1 hypothetical protein GCM10010923_11680 [Blastomonas marina]